MEEGEMKALTKSSLAAQRTAPGGDLSGTTRRVGAKGRRALLALPVGKGVGLAEGREAEDISEDAMAHG